MINKTTKGLLTNTLFSLAATTLLIIVASLLLVHPQKVHADAPPPIVPNGMAGSGFSADPFRVTNCTDLQNISLNLGYDHVLTSNIDCSDTVNWHGGAGFMPIGLNSGGSVIGPFYGTFDGHGHTISGLYIDQSSNTNDTAGDVGLFASSSGYLQNFKLSGATVIGNTSLSSGSTAGVVGHMSSNMSDVQFSGSISTADCANVQSLGGLVGEDQDNGTITNSSASGSITVSGPDCGSYGYRAGGLVGVIGLNTTITNGYSTMDITLDGSATSSCDSADCRLVGGLIGTGNTSTITDSYASGSLTISGDTGSFLSYQVGGLVGLGQPTISNSFAATPITVPPPCSDLDCGSGPRVTGAMAGNTFSPVDYTSNYYDQTVIGVGICDNSGGTSCTAINTGASPDPTYFDNNSSNPPLDQWDFSTVWQTTSGLPTLRATNPNPDPPTNLSATINSITSINLTWDAPSNTGSSSFYQYAIVYQKVGDSSWSEVYGDGTSYTLTDLMPGTQYTIKIATQNSDRYWSTASDPIQGITATPGFHLISTCQQFQDINNNLMDNYELTQNIDCSDTVNWNGGGGFLPISGCTGGGDSAFIGALEGNNYSISNLFSDLATTGCITSAPFGTAGRALFQDIRIESPIISGGSGSEAAGFVALDVGSTITNVRVTNGTITGSPAVAGGLVAVELRGAGYETGADAVTHSQNEFTGIIALDGATTGNTINSVGGLYGAVYLAPGVLTVTNSYANADITFTNANIDNLAIGGFVGAHFAFSSVMTISNSYSTGSITIADSTIGAQSVGGFFGDAAPDNNSQLTLNDSFAHVDMSGIIPGGEAAIGGFLGNSNSSIPGGVASNAFDATLAGTDQCTGDLSADCTAISGQPNYFYNNHTNPPLDSWDFTNIWQTTSTLPIFGVKASTTITAIPASRLTPPVTPSPPAAYAASPTPTLAPAEPSAKSFAPAITQSTNPPTSPTPSDDGLIGQIKQFLQHVPAIVLVSFPYALFGLLILGVLIMLLEMWHQARRLRVLRGLLAEQKTIAEERDTFWHLAANYLRAPITLLTGGADLLLHSKPTSQAATKIGRLTTIMQSSVADIMQKIESSQSLQGITWPKLHPVRKVIRSLRFWLPLLLVAALAILADYVAIGYRHLNVGLLSYGAQAIIFVLIGFVLYRVLNALGLVSRKREQAESLLAKQTIALDGARSELIRTTAEALDDDLINLEGLLSGLPQKERSLPTLHEGAHRLRHMIDSFRLLISAQNNSLDSLSPANAMTSLDATLTGALAELQPEIATKQLKVNQPHLGALVVPGSPQLLEQVIVSVLSNAVAFSPAKGTVTMETIAQRGRTSLRITDQGPGVSKDQLSHMFRPFTKADGLDALQLDHGGLGINLYLDKLIMEYLGGSISVDSTAGTGTTLTLQWPIQ